MHSGASGVRQGNHDIVRVEEVSLMPTLLSTLALILRARYHYRHLVVYHRIHHQIKYGGGERISLRHPARSLERRPLINTCIYNHREPPPVCL